MHCCHVHEQYLLLLSSDKNRLSYNMHNRSSASVATYIVLYCFLGHFFIADIIRFSGSNKHLKSILIQIRSIIMTWDVTPFLSKYDVIITTLIFLINNPISDSFQFLQLGREINRMFFQILNSFFHLRRIAIQVLNFICHGFCT